MDISTFVEELEKLDYDQVPEKLLEHAFRKEYTLKALEDVSARTLQSWFDSGLLPYEKLQKGQKHWFNFVHLIWLYIVKELRVFGVPLNTIRNAKEELLDEYTMEEFIRPQNVMVAISILEIFNVFDQSKEKEFKAWFKQFKKGGNKESLEEFFGKQTPLISDLFTLLVQMILGEEKVILTINRDGHVESFTSDDAVLFNRFIGFNTKIVLPLNYFFEYYVGESKHLGFLEGTGMINKTEANLLKQIHKGEFDKISIRFKDKKMELLEFSRQISKADIRKINNILARRQHLEINIKSANGDIRYLNVTKRVKLK